MRVAHRVAALASSSTVELADRIRTMRASGTDIIDLTGGEPDFDTPAAVVDEAVRALRDGFTHYTSSSGVPELRAAIADKLRTDNGVIVDPEFGICVTPSAKHALFAAIMTVLDPGDELMIMTPGWVSYESMVSLAGGSIAKVPLEARDGAFRVTQGALEAAVNSRTRAILVNTPNNPTGNVLTVREVETIAEFAERHDLFIISDEIYEKVIYSGYRHRSLAAHPKAGARTFTVNGFSKGYAMTGWRLGYVAGPSFAIQQLLKVHQHTVSCASSFVQRGGLAALTETEEAVTDMTREYERRRNLVVHGLNRIPGIRCALPEGAFYAFPSVEELGVGTGVDTASWLLEEAQVAVTPGEVFGPGGEGRVRLSFAASYDVLAEALRRIETVCRYRPAAGYVTPSTITTSLTTGEYTV
ncbi:MULTISPECIES: pyridoxal phosphate-dependent aminotransferase [Rhodococcus]|uniref:Aminotransferase n=1 Tax=Rhodococcus rhodochrous TaxID=1829 RepID=A0AAW4XM23_RHORH|nr:MULTISPECIES: pyridoxal phosphate-dependent aminotransferase [Rhodococcus]MCD2113522.1 pyridoxal phosphate-dependent aminotransferase [Rhodococcus rhodochrous]QHG81673.1 pyridoxal phosphate-dependent aminotransferase [Rhodococcus rhodochrous]QOH58650.1 aspartate aminotransferase [Rhodococcus rhodochrous]WAL46316.1 pyridoxal phosphate-dependent aminotransferase [Rhodococcus pyridinivorans]